MGREAEAGGRSRPQVDRQIECRTQWIRVRISCTEVLQLRALPICSAQWVLALGQIFSYPAAVGSPLAVARQGFFVFSDLGAQSGPDRKAHPKLSLSKQMGREELGPCCKRAAKK